MKILALIFLLIALVCLVLVVAACMRSSQITRQEEARRLFHG
jgi:hypothetical protein